MKEIKEQRKQRYKEKLDKMERRIRKVEEWISSGVTTLERRLAIYKAFQEITEAMADICAMFNSDTSYSVGDDYQNITHAAGELFAASLEADCKEANGLRNRLVHEYNGLNNKRALQSIRRLLPSISKFIREVIQWIQR